VSGRFVVVEGIDGAGKTTVAARLASALGARLTHEPGATPVGARLRALVVDQGLGPLHPITEALVLAADRAEHVARLVRPWLEAGEWVVSDRYAASTLAYQGAGRGLDERALGALVEFATGGLMADLNVLLDLPVSLARARREASGRAPDRLEAEKPAMIERVAAAYRRLAAAEPSRWVVVDASAPLDHVVEVVLGAVFERLGRPAHGDESFEPSMPKRATRRPAGDRP
jgi:dTMP kinase